MITCIHLVRACTCENYQTRVNIQHANTCHMHGIVLEDGQARTQKERQRERGVRRQFVQVFVDQYAVHLKGFLAKESSDRGFESGCRTAGFDFVEYRSELGVGAPAISPLTSIMRYLAKRPGLLLESVVTKAPTARTKGSQGFGSRSRRT